jgi:hypothetical protein
VSVGTSASVLDHLPYVYAAAACACGDEAAAARVTERVLLSAACEQADAANTRRVLVERAILLAVRVAPAEPFARIDEADRDAVALARLGRYSVSDIALALEVSVTAVKARIRRGLTALAVSRDGAPRMPRPPRDFETAASPARAGHASSLSSR